MMVDRDDVGGRPPWEGRDVMARAAGLAQRLAYLPAADRAGLLDGLYWSEARTRLPHEVVTAVINRRSTAAFAAAVDAYAAYCRALTTAALLALDEPSRIADVATALTCRLSLLDAHRLAGEAWLDDDHWPGAARELAHRPGYAFLLLALSLSDSAESLIARDAFFAAILGST